MEKWVSYLGILFHLNKTKLFSSLRFWLKNLNCGFFTRFTYEKRTQNNISHQNFSVENNYLFLVVFVHKKKRQDHIPQLPLIRCLLGRNGNVQQVLAQSAHNCSWKKSALCENRNMLQSRYFMQYIPQKSQKKLLRGLPRLI